MTPVWTRVVAGVMKRWPRRRHTQEEHCSLITVPGGEEAFLLGHLGGHGTSGLKRWGEAGNAWGEAGRRTRTRKLHSRSPGHRGYQRAQREQCNDTSHSSLRAEDGEWGHLFQGGVTTFPVLPKTAPVCSVVPEESPTAPSFAVTRGLR